MKNKKYKFELGFTEIRYSIRDKLKLSNHQYAIVHALTFVGKKNNQKNESKNDRSNYNPTPESLAKDLGFGRATIFRALPILRKKGLVEPDCLEATDYFVAMMMEKKETRDYYDKIEHGPRQKIGYNFTKYLTCIVYERLSQGQWATLDKKEVIKTLNLKSVDYLNRLIRKIEVDGYMETQARQMKKGGIFIDVKMTEKWKNLSTKVSKKPKKKVSKRLEKVSKSLPTNNYTNNSTNNILFDKSNKSAERPKKEKKKNSKISGKEINDLIQLFEPLNSSYKAFFADFVQRSYCTKLLQDKNKEDIIKILNQYQQSEPEQYRPHLYTPADLYSKWDKIQNYLNKPKPITTNRAPDSGKDFDKHCKVQNINVDLPENNTQSREEQMAELAELYYAQ